MIFSALKYILFVMEAYLTMESQPFLKEIVQMGLLIHSTRLHCEFRRKPDYLSIFSETFIIMYYHGVHYFTTLEFEISIIF